MIKIPVPADFIPYQQALLDDSLRRSSSKENLNLGVPYLDDALEGIPDSTLLLLGARTGVGKTQLASQIAHANAAQGKRVHFFALEAEKGEVQARQMYQLLAQYWHHKKLYLDHPDIQLSYIRWHAGLYRDRFAALETELKEFLFNAYRTFFTYYRGSGDFTTAVFRNIFARIQDETDLVVVDHLHYFDFEDINENKALRDAMKAIRDAALIAKKPVILVAHLRKRDRTIKSIMPDLDDFHGSSELTKMATDVVLLSPARATEKSNERWSTLLRVAKCRRDGARTRYFGVCNFSTHRMVYDDKYYLSKWFEGQEELELTAELPYWAKNAVAPKSNLATNYYRKYEEKTDD